MRRKEAALLSSLLDEYIKQSRIGDEFVKLEIYGRWEKEASAMGVSTIHRFFSSGVLYCTVSSSVARSRLYYSLPRIIERINMGVPGNPLKRIVLK